MVDNQSKPLKVLYIATECKPFVKVGGIGDVAGELPVELRKQGVDIEIVIPLYGCSKFNIDGKEPVYNFEIAYNYKDENIRIYEDRIEDIPVYLLKNETYFENGKFANVFIHSDPPYYDDSRRFAFFSRACLEFIKIRNPDIVHINDWMLGYLFGWMEIEKMPQKRVITIHNMYQGNIATQHILGTPIEEILANKETGPLFTNPGTEWDGINPLRLALELCDRANTVSPGYCREITQMEDQNRYFEGGKGLHEITRRLYDEGKLKGILNGFNYKNNGKFDRVIKEKQKMKECLSVYFKRQRGEDFMKTPLIGFVGRAVEQKFKLLKETVMVFDKTQTVLEHILDIEGVNVAILSTGLPEYESFIGNMSTSRFEGYTGYDGFLGTGRRKNYVSFVAFDVEMAKKISLGCDIFLMPSLFEPCGITQLESMTCATPPLVRWTGGLIDTVGAVDTGFGFDGGFREEVLYNFIKAVHEAIGLYRSDPAGFAEKQKRCFKTRFPWSASAAQYINELYK